MVDRAAGRDEGLAGKSVRYTAYGLIFDSDLELPEFSLTDDGADVQRADVQIMLGSVPEHLDNAESTGVLYEISADGFLLHVPDVASYLVTHNRIVVEVNSAASTHEARVFMLGSAMGALLHLRRLLVLHAAAFSVDAGAVLLAGDSGAGKSTLLGAMLDRGHPMIVDDVCAIDLDDGAPRVRAGYPRTRLWADSAGKLDVDTSALDRTRPTLEKYERHVPELFAPGPRPLRAIFVLGTHNEDSVTTERLGSIDAFTAVLANTYRRAFLSGLKMRDDHFQLASAISASVPITRVTRPAAGFDLDRLAQVIDEELSSEVGTP